MTYEILFTESSEKDLKRLDKETQRRIISALERIRITPEKHVRKLVGVPGYRLRAGDYRIILDIKKDKLIVLVLKAGHRKNVYD